MEKKKNEILELKRQKHKHDNIHKATMNDIVYENDIIQINNIARETPNSP